MSRFEIVVADPCGLTRRCFRDVVSRLSLAAELSFVDDTPAFADRLKQPHTIFFLDPELAGGNAMEALAAARKAGSRALVVVMASDRAMPPREVLRGLNVYEALDKPLDTAAVTAVLNNLQRLAAVTSALVVDDSPGVRMVVRKVLASSMFRLAVDEASDGEAAVSHCGARPCDLVFLDCSLPGRDGLAVLPRLLGAQPAAKVIMMAEGRDGERAQQATQSGAKAALTKPFYPADIDRTLHAVFGLQQPRLTADAPRITIEI